jgi:hypothetical protein
VGSGGRGLYNLDESDARLAAFDEKHHGALRLMLQRGRVNYRFMRADGKTGDQGSLNCRPRN